MINTMRMAAMAMLTLTGCATQLNPGAERIMVVESDAAVRDMTLLASTRGEIGRARVGELTNIAKNFGQQAGAERVLLRRSSGPGLVSYTLEAWTQCKPPNSSLNAIAT